MCRVKQVIVALVLAGVIGTGTAYATTFYYWACWRYIAGYPVSWGYIINTDGSDPSYSDLFSTVQCVFAGATEGEYPYDQSP